jgi:uroporphyrinogen-III synthase
VYRTLPLTLDCTDPPQTGSTEPFSASHSSTPEAPAHSAAAADCISTWLAFFSPSGVAAATESFGAARLLACQRAAIGPTTAAALAEAQMHAHAVAQRPAPDALREAIERAIGEAAAAAKVAAELQ